MVIPQVGWFSFLLLGAAGTAVEAQILLYAGFDGSTEARGPTTTQANVYTRPFPRPEAAYRKGVCGLAAVLGEGLQGGEQVVYPMDPHWDRARGSLLLWFRRGGPGQTAPGARSPVSPNVLPDEGGRMMLALVSDGQWHHVAVTWDFPARRRTLVLDGKPLVEWKMTRPLGDPVVRLGDRFPCEVDELYVLDAPLSAEEIARAFRQGQEGKPPWPPRLLPGGGESFYPLRNFRSEGPRPRLPDAVVWKLSEPDEVSPGGLRQRYRLVGPWRIQPAHPSEPFPAAGDWGLAAVPGLWRGEGAQVLDASLSPVSPGRGAWASAGAAWLERDVERPGGSEGKKRYRLLFDDTACSGDGVYPSDVYFNGTYLGGLFDWEARAFDLTDLMKEKGQNRIQVLQGRPYGEVRRAGMSGDVWLEVCPGGPALIEPGIFVRSAVAEKQLGVEFALEEGEGPRGLQLWCCVADAADPTREQWLGPAALKGPERGLRQAWFSWPQAIAWSPARPKLYRLHLQVRSKEQPLDETFPVRFGFRDLAISGSSMLLNGRPLAMRGTAEIGPASGATIDSTILAAQLLGYNCGQVEARTAGEADGALEAADRLGWLVHVVLAEPQADFLRGPNAASARRYAAARMDRLANHPSLVLWRLKAPAPAASPGDASAGETRPARLGASAANEEAARILREMDPSRPITFEDGLGADLLGLRVKFGPWTPLQAQEEYPAAWVTAGQRPVVITAGELLPLRSLFLWQRGPDQDVPAVAEHAARCLGASAYRKVDTADALTLSRPGKTSEMHWARHPLVEHLRAAATTRVIRTWRTFGISYLLEPAGLGNAAEPLEAASAAWNAEVALFIAGPGDQPAARDHAYFPGETVHRTVYLLNGREQLISAHLETGWSTGPGQETVPARSRQVCNAEPGSIARIPVETVVPAASDRATLRLESKAEVKAGPEGGASLFLSDSMDFQIFPRFQLPETVRKRRTLLLDPEGSAARILRAEGMPFVSFSEEARPSEYDLLLLGRKAADPVTLRGLRRMKLGEAVEGGLNVVVLEQPYREVLGLRTESFPCREVFVRSPHAALLQGLRDGDFRDWRWPPRAWKPGERGPDEAAWPGPAEALNAFGQRRSGLWCARGIVASFCYQKPQRGNFEVFLENGFDLLYTPLVEFRRGRGRVLFCQLDVTDRHGHDPVATLLVQRMLAEYTVRGQQALSPAFYVGGPPGRSLLEQFGVPSEDLLAKGGPAPDLARPVVADLREATPLPRRQALALQSFVARGGKLLQIVASSRSDTGWLPGDVAFLRRAVFCTEIPEQPEWDGLGDSDFFWRFPMLIPTIAQTPPRGYRLDSGAVARVPFGLGLGVLCQFEPSMFRDPWPRSKAARVLATILTRLGARSHAGLDLDAPGMPAAPGPYVEEALDFDPDEPGPPRQ